MNIFHIFSIIPLQKWFKKHKLEIFNVKKQKIHGGTIRVFVSKQKQYKINKSVNKIQEQEEKFGIKRMQTYDNFLNRIELLKKIIEKNYF